MFCFYVNRRHMFLVCVCVCRLCTHVSDLTRPMTMCERKTPTRAHARLDPRSNHLPSTQQHFCQHGPRSPYCVQCVQLYRADTVQRSTPAPRSSRSAMIQPVWHAHSPSASVCLGPCSRMRDMVRTPDGRVL